MIDAHKAALDVIEANQYAPTGVCIRKYSLEYQLTDIIGVATFQPSVVASLLSTVWKTS